MRKVLVLLGLFVLLTARITAQDPEPDLEMVEKRWAFVNSRGESPSQKITRGVTKVDTLVFLEGEEYTVTINVRNIAQKTYKGKIRLCISNTKSTEYKEFTIGDEIDVTLASGEIREITFHFDYDGINGFGRSGVYYLTIDCTDDKQDRYPWLPITGEDVIVGEECLQNSIRSGEELYHKSKALQRKQNEMNAIHDTSSMIPREHDPNEDIYYNNDLSFPHYHQIKILT